MYHSISELFKSMCNNCFSITIAQYHLLTLFLPKFTYTIVGKRISRESPSDAQTGFKKRRSRSFQETFDRSRCCCRIIVTYARKETVYVEYTTLTIEQINRQTDRQTDRLTDNKIHICC